MNKLSEARKKYKETLDKAKKINIMLSVDYLEYDREMKKIHDKVKKGLLKKIG